MGLIRTVAVIVLSISAVVFVALFGRLPAFRKTPVGLLHRLLLVHVPAFIVKIDRVLTGQRVTNSLRWFFDYLVNEAHPLVLILFVALQLGGEILFIPPSLEYISPWPHYFIIPVVVVLPLWTLYLSYTTASTVTHANHRECLSAYPYDYILFHPEMPCETCKFSKPPRSKHCSICKVCVQRQDHHCIWINNCVGRNNYVHFLSLLLTVSVLLGYATGLGYSILNTITQDRLIPPELTRGSFTKKHWATKLTWSEYLDRWMVTISLSPRIGATTLLTFFCFPLALGFLVFHAYLIWAGMSTNESAKWSDLREDIYDDIVFKAKIDDMKRDYPGPLGEQVNPGAKRWRIPSEWWIIRTRQGQHPTRRVADEQGRVIPDAEEVDDRWVRVVDLPEIINVYDLGFRKNLEDSLFNRGAWMRR